MTEIERMLKQLGRKTMFNIGDDEIPKLMEEYHMFMKYVQFLDSIDTQDIEPLVFPYNVEISYLRDDEAIYTISQEDALKNAKNVQDNQVKIPRVVR